MSKVVFILLSLLSVGNIYAAGQGFSPHAHKRHKAAKQTLVREPDNQQRRYLTGDWDHARSLLADKGITITGVYVTDVVGNPIGGKARGISYAGSFGLDLMIDLDQSTPMKGWSFYTSLVWRTGTSLSERKIGNQYPVQQVFGSQTIKLNCLYLQKELFNDSIMVRFGRLNGGDTFLQSPLFYNYVNNAINGNPISVFFSTPFTAYPNAVWGAYLRLLPVKQFEFKLGAYQGSKKINENRFHGINFTFEAPNGVLWASELSYHYTTDSGSYPGNYKLGYFYINRASRNILSNESMNNKVLYVQLDQQVYEIDKEKDRGLSAFFTSVFMPKNRNLLPFFFISGVVMQGPFSWRDKDAIAIGTAFGNYSDYLRQKQRSEGLEEQTYEWMWEINYNAHITPWFWLQPDLQYIIRPKGYTSRPNAWVLGFQSQLNF